jgi:hypothetical protein
VKYYKEKFELFEEFNGNWTCNTQSTEWDLELDFVGKNPGVRKFTVDISTPSIHSVMKLTDIQTGEVLSFQWNAW